MSVDNCVQVEKEFYDHANKATVIEGARVFFQSSLQIILGFHHRAQRAITKVASRVSRMID